MSIFWPQFSCMMFKIDCSSKWGPQCGKTCLAAQKKPWFQPYQTPFDELEQQVPARFYRRVSVTNHRHGNKSLQHFFFLFFYGVNIKSFVHILLAMQCMQIYSFIFNNCTDVFTFGSLIIRSLQPDSSQRSKVRLVHNARKRAFYVWGATGFHLLWVFGEYWHIDSCMCVFHCASLSLRELSLRLKCVFSHRARQAPCCSWLKQPL